MPTANTNEFNAGRAQRVAKLLRDDLYKPFQYEQQYNRGDLFALYCKLMDEELKGTEPDYTEALAFAKYYT